MTSRHDPDTLDAQSPAAAGEDPPRSIQPRRSFLASALATVVGGLLALFPVVVGMIPFLDPLRSRKNRLPLQARSSEDSEGYIPLGPLETLPDDGTPRLVQVVADEMNAWNFSPQQRIGSVYLRKIPAGSQGEPPTVIAFNVSCPHLGCFVDFRSESGKFFCPCHKSTFSKDGRRSPESPSPRNLDQLDVQLRDGEVWVKYQNFRTGTSERIPVA